MQVTRNLSVFKEKLLSRRNELIGLRQDVDNAWRTLHEPEVEIEEISQKENIAQPLDNLDEQEKAELEAIDEALRKLEAGSYGYCDSCGKAIPDGRLQAIPWTKHCIACEQQQESRERLAAEKTGAAAGVKKGPAQQSRAEAGRTKSSKEIAMEGEDVEKDIHHAQKSGKPVSPPRRIVPEKKPE